MGHEVKIDQDNKCYEAALKFQGCIDAGGCGDSETWFCMNDELYLSPDTCGADGWTECKDPGLSQCK
jgi:hypothetical protein